MSTPRLVAITGPCKHASFALEQEQFSIGRDASNQLSLADTLVARRHCVLVRKPEGFLVRDLGSRSGTLVNGATTSEVLLQHGDRIAVGDSTFMFLEHDGELTAPNPAGPNIAFYDLPLPEKSVLELPLDDPDKLIDAIPGSDHLAQELSTLLHVATYIGRVPDLESLQWQLLGTLFDLVPADRAAILMFSSASDEPASAAAWDRASGPAAAVSINRTVLSKVSEQRAGLLVNGGPQQGSPAAVSNREAQSYRPILCVPLMISGRVAGVIYLDSSRSHAFSEHHLRLMTAVAGIAALAAENARRLEALRSENRRLRTEIAIEHDMIGKSPAIVAVFQKIARLAPSDANILIYGESGTGKELAAHALHRNSPRSEKPFVAINCAAITETLLESELFGHEKGAFTGAVAAKPGQFEVAEGGTIFLDEIGELAPALQAKLLRVLQQREYFRVGGTRPIRIDVRLVAATNRDLAAEVAAGRFRQDLYYRLNVVSCTMPPLRERRTDIPLLAQHFAERFCRRCKRPIQGISPEALAYLSNYSWPGNIRELENAIEHAVLLGSSDWILPEDLPESVLETPSDGPASSRYHDAVLALKKDLITRAVEQANGNYTEAARLLDLHPNYLHRLMRNMNLKTRVHGE